MNAVLSDGTVVVAWTPDELGALALEHGMAEARLRSYRLVVVNTSRGDALVDTRYARPEALETLHADLAASGVPHVVHQTVAGDVAEEILRVADEAGAAMVVLGLRRRTPVGKLLMGSVAQRVLLDAQCPVLAVKPR